MTYWHDLAQAGLADSQTALTKTPGQRQFPGELTESSRFRTTKLDADLGGHRTQNFVQDLLA